jgi:hypothetical protein
MEYRAPYPWYFQPPIRGISNLLLMIYRTLSMVYGTPYPWYIEPPTHGIFNALPMGYQPLTQGLSEPMVY